MILSPSLLFSFKAQNKCLRSCTHSFINYFIYTLRDPYEDGAAEVLLSSALKTIQRSYRIY